MGYQPEGRTKVARLEAELDALLQRLDELLRNPDADLELRNDLAKFACVRICGYIEQSLLSLATHHCGLRSSTTALHFATSFLERAQNPTRSGLVAFASRFDPTWGAELEALFDAIDPSGTFNSLVKTRNDVAHGLSTGIGKDTLDRHVDLVKQIVRWFTDKFDPLPKAASIKAGKKPKGRRKRRGGS